VSKIALYEGIKADLMQVTALKGDNTPMRFKKVELWRNNLQRETKEQAFLFPSCFVEFLPSNYMELSSGVQSYDLTVRLHICFESYKDEDVDVLRLTDAVYAAMQGKQYSYFAKMKRRDETQDFDHDNVQDYMQDYYVGKAKDFGADARPTTEAQIDEIIINTEEISALTLLTEGDEPILTEDNNLIEA
jgi:hypothetical protein